MTYAVDPEVRFWAKVQKTESCWIWLAGKNYDGYGKFRVDRRTWRAHRYAYVMAKGSIPEGLVLDHLCRNHACVNPAHLEAVTNRENILRGEAFSAVYAARTHCKHGHEFTPETTRIHRNARICLICERRKDHKRRPPGTKRT